MGCLEHQHLSLNASFLIASKSSKYSTMKICLSKYCSPKMTDSLDFFSLKSWTNLVTEFSGLSWPKLVKKCWNSSRVLDTFSFFWSNSFKRISRFWILFSILNLCLLWAQLNIFGFQGVGLFGLGVMAWPIRAFIELVEWFPKSKNYSMKDYSVRLLYSLKNQLWLLQTLKLRFFEIFPKWSSLQRGLKKIFQNCWFEAMLPIVIIYFQCCDGKSSLVVFFHEWWNERKKIPR